MGDRPARTSINEQLTIRGGNMSNPKRARSWAMTCGFKPRTNCFTAESFTQTIGTGQNNPDTGMLRHARSM